MAIPFVVPRARFLNKDGEPLSYGRVKFYSAGTSELKSVYLTNVEAEGNEATNPHRLDSEGFVRDGGIWLGAGAYKVVVESFDGLDQNGEKRYSIEWTMDNIPGDGVLNEQILSSSVITTVSKLRELEAGKYSALYCLGHESTSDNGGGWFEWESESTKADDNGSVIAPNGDPAQGRYERRFNGAVIYPQMWAAFPNDDTLNLDGNFTKMIEFATNNTQHSRILIPAGEWYLNGDVLFDEKITVEVQEGAEFKNSELDVATVSFSCYDAIIHSYKTPLVDNEKIKLVFDIENLDREVYPEWWGADGSDINVNDTIPLVEMRLGLVKNGLRVVFSGGDGYYFGSVSFSLDLSAHVVIFRTKSKLTYEANGDLKIDAFSIEGDGSVFGGDFKHLNFGDRLKYELDWFDIYESGVNVDVDKYNDLMDQVTNSGDKRVEFEWLRGEYSFSGFFNTVVKVSTALTHDINGAVLKWNTDNHPYFGYIRNCNGGISTDSSSYPSVFNKEIDVRWFGAQPYVIDETVQDLNRLALIMAWDVQIVSSLADDIDSPVVTGDDSIYWISSGISYTPVPNVSLNTPVKMKNITIHSTGSFAPIVVFPSFYMIVINGNMENEKVVFRNNQNEINLLRVTGDYKDYKTKTLNLVSSGNVKSIVHTGSGSFISKKSEFEARNGFTTSASEFEFVGSESRSSVDGPVIVSDNIYIHEGVLDYEFDATVNESGQISNCKLEACKLDVRGAGVVAVVANDIKSNSQLSIRNSGICLVSNNDFYNSTLTFRDTIQKINAIGNVFHQVSNTSPIIFYPPSAGYVVDNVRIENNSFSKELGTSVDMVEVVVGAGSLAGLGHDVTIKDNDVSGLINIKSTESEQVVSYNAEDEFGAITGSTFGKGKKLTLTTPGELLTEFKNVNGYVIDEVNTSEVETGSQNDLETGPIGVYNVEGIGSTFEVVMRWFGNTTGTGGDFTFDLFIRIRVSKEK